MMNRDDAIVNPLKGKGTPHLGPVAAMVASQGDLSSLCRLMGLKNEDSRRLFTSRLYTRTNGAGGFSVAGPFIGAPYAVMLLETLIAWGVTKIIFFGWCGAVSPEVKIGDIIVPTAAMIDEGTSRHYGVNEGECVASSGRIVEKIQKRLTKDGLSYHAGVIWSTDAIYRETPEKVADYQKKDVLAVEMELSALFTIGRYRGIDVGGVLVVSDELSSYKWHPGFNDGNFKQSRQKVIRTIFQLCPAL